MKVPYDLHIHSALSPCGDEDMTPNNIVNMAVIKGLKLISVTDHNTMLNVAPTIEVAQNHDVLVIPGIEVTTKEDIHVLCYFPNLHDGMKFQDFIYSGIPDTQNVEEIFGKQTLLDRNDRVTGYINKLLLNSTKYTIEETYELTRIHNGAMVPAHIDKSSYSIVSSLGFIPDTLKVHSVEVYDEKKLKDLSKFIDMNRYKIISNSDAHYLVDIKEAISFLDIESLTTRAVISYLNGMEE